MSGEMVPVNEALAGVLVPSKYGTDKDFDNVASAVSFLPRLQLLGSSSNLCKKGLMPIGTYAIIQNKDTILSDLGKQFDCLVLSWRPKALKIDGDDTRAFYNPNSPAYKEVEAEGLKKTQGYLYGPEYLVYCPSAGKFATFFFGNPTMRRAAPFMKPLIGKAATVKVELIERKVYSWHGPVITACSTPLELPQDADFIDRVKKEVVKFNSPPEEEELEEASEEERAR